MNQRLKKFIRRVSRLLLYFIVSSIILTLLEIGVGYWLLSTRWKMYMSKEQMQEFAEEINQSPPAPPNWKKVYLTIHPKHLTSSMADQLFFNYAYRYLFITTELDDYPNCYCDRVIDIQEMHNEKLRSIEWHSRMKELEYAFGIEKYSSPEKCFDYVIPRKIEEVKFLLNRERYSNFFEKPIEDYTDDEIIEMMLLIVSEEKYNKFRNPEIFKRAFKQYKDKLEAEEIKVMPN